MVRFYRDDLRLRPIVEKNWFVEFQLSSDSSVSLADHDRATIKSAHGGGITLSVQVNDVEQTRTELVTNGLNPEPLRTIWGSRAFFLYDPEGNRLEFWS